jgi:hypothetical protein
MDHSAQIHLDQKVIDWLRNVKPDAGETEIRSADLIESRILDSMQFLDFVYFLNELCDCDVTSKITVEDMRSLPRITAFVEAQNTEWRMAS